MKRRKSRKFTRRRFLKTASASAAAVTVGVPFFAKHASAAPITIKIQSMWDAGTLGYTLFKEFAENVSNASEGKLIVKPFPAKAMVGTMEMFDAVKAGVFEGMHTSDSYQPGKIPCATFLTSYPFGMDRPDQWETWFNSLGGKEIAREAYAAA